MTKHNNNNNNKKTETKLEPILEHEPKLIMEQNKHLENIELHIENHSIQTVIPFTAEPVSLVKTDVDADADADADATNLSNIEFEYANKDPDTTKTNKHILDPLSVVIKLAVLSKKPLGTKCCVYNNVLYIQDKSPIQAIIRFLYKINKFELNYLYNPIHIACQTYLCGPHKKRIEGLFVYAQKGLKQLIETYSEHNHIKHMLIMYSTIIDSYIYDKPNKQLFVKDNNSCLYNTTVLEKSAKIWRSDRIGLLINMIDFINNDIVCKYKYEGETTKLLEEFQGQIDAEFTEDLDR